MQGVTAIQRTPPHPGPLASGVAAQITEVERTIQSDPSSLSHIARLPPPRLALYDEPGPTTAGSPTVQRPFGSCAVVVLTNRNHDGPKLLTQLHVPVGRHDLFEWKAAVDQRSVRPGFELRRKASDHRLVDVRIREADLSTSHERGGECVPSVIGAASSRRWSFGTSAIGPVDRAMRYSAWAPKRPSIQPKDAIPSCESLRTGSESLDDTGIFRTEDGGSWSAPTSHRVHQQWPPRPVVAVCPIHGCGVHRDEDVVLAGLGNGHVANLDDLWRTEAKRYSGTHRRPPCVPASRWGRTGSPVRLLSPELARWGSQWGVGALTAFAGRRLP